MKKFTKVLACLLVLVMVFGLAACGGGGAQNNTSNDTNNTGNETKEWTPAKEITIINPWAAGGAGDIASRLLSEIVKEQTGYTVVVEDVTGGSSAVGLTQVMSDTSGYTIGLASSSWLSLVALKTVPFSWDDCAVASCLYDEAFFILVPKNSPYADCQALMDAVKANPGTITCGGSGSANVNQTLPVLLANSVGSSFNYTPFDGGSRVLSEILGGHLDCCILKPVECGPSVASGDLKVMGVFGNSRLENYPDVKTFVEMGYDIYKDGQVDMVDFWLANAKADKETLEHVMDIIINAMNSDKFKEYCKTNSVTLNPIRGEEGRKYITDVYNGIDKLFNQLYKK